MLLCLLCINANALVVSVNGQGEVPSEGMEIYLSEPEEDLLTGDMRYAVTGSLMTTNPLTVTITRSKAGFTDEFCCANQCTAGNGETGEQLEFTPNGIADWYVHLTLDNGSGVVTYCFSDGAESRTLIVHYIDPVDGLESVTGSPASLTRKTLRDGIICIERGENTYTLQGTITNQQ